MDPIRSEQTVNVVVNPWKPAERICSDDAADHSLSDRGAIQSLRTSRQFAGDCGCASQAPGGFCGECQSLVCVKCFGHCIDCRKPLCEKHSVYEANAGAASRRCRECAGAARRHQLAARVGRALLFLFVKPKDEK